MEDYLKNVAIIGAGLGGCALALALTDQNIPVTVYESRPEISGVIPSGVILTPNGLRVLDHLGVFERIRDRCYVPQFRVFKNSRDETTKKIPTDESQRFGYANHRVWREILLDEMRLMLAERGHMARIHFNSRFHGITADAPDHDHDGHVTFLINHTPRSASLLIGADGIHSAVRAALAPGIVPVYTGLVGIICHIKRSAVAWPYPSYESNATIQDRPGAIFWIAEDPGGEDLMIGRQVRHPQPTKADLDALHADRDRMLRFYTDDRDAFGHTARKIIDQVRRNADSLYLWPFMKMPPLPRWFSPSGRVVLLGDGAHALPPSSGQGVNQALEDVYSLTLMLGALRERGGSGSVTDALAKWQQVRQERIDAVLDWTDRGSNVARLPEAERKKLLDEGKVKDDQYDDMAWLYRPGVYDELLTWVERNA